jgi:hypothetical protein
MLCCISKYYFLLMKYIPGHVPKKNLTVQMLRIDPTTIGLDHIPRHLTMLPAPCLTDLLLVKKTYYQKSC